MSRVFTFLLAGVLAGCFSCGEATAQQATAQQAASQQAGEKHSDAITERLDEILKRLDSIESRLGQLESQVFAFRWRADERGILRDAQGRPLGFWGIDTPAKTPTRR